MSKERNRFKETMKKPAMTLKEKRAAKKAKKSGVTTTFIPSEKK